MAIKTSRCRECGEYHGPLDPHPPPISTVTELTDEQADWLIQRLEWAAGLSVSMSAQFAATFGVGVELGVRDEHREEARAAVRRIARVERYET